MEVSAGSPTPARQDSATERDALKRVLESGVLERAPNLEHILRYVCGKFFEGRIDEVKEYNIAVDALGRGPGFDQKKDSIVRVEAHRLRKRLAAYYAGVGSNDPLEIVIPPGTYVPTFALRSNAIQDVLPAAITAEVPDQPPASAGMRFPWFWVAALAGFAGIAAFVFLRPAAHAVPVPAPLARVDAVQIVAGANREGIRILAGSDRERTLDHLGNSWLADQFVTGGDVRTSAQRMIFRTPDPSLYLTRREGNFSYAIPVRPGFHEVRLHFAETVFGEGNSASGGETSRIFAVKVNEQPDPEVVDVISNAAGANVAWTRVFRGISPAADGKIHIRFSSHLKEQAFVNGIEILPSPDRRALPVRVLAASTPYIDQKRQRWNPDEYFIGGQTIMRHEPIHGAVDPELFRGERYGNFNYSLPVDPGSRYTVNLYFAETYFGPNRPGGDIAEARLFDVYCGGRSLLHRFDLLKEAGGPLRGLVKSFHGLEPNAQGQLLLHFVPIRNYAVINAIEVIDEGR
ncbi:MAG: hypothetical protein H7039_08640 [Bryobacteraceae bacterium]|nr:hypothetical protein [Bryobacteraceae bacterium]